MSSALFRKIWCIYLHPVRSYWHFFYFTWPKNPRWRQPASCIFRLWEFGHSDVLIVWHLCSVPNLVQISVIVTTVKWCLKNVLSGKRLSGNSNCPGIVCPGNVLSGKRLSGKRLVRESSVRETSCPGNVCPGKWLSGKRPHTVSTKVTNSYQN